MGSDNTAIGVALVSNTAGSGNVAIGLDSLFSNTTGGSNTAVGENALSANGAGNYNTATGFGALYSNPCQANYNTGVGYFAGYTANSLVTCGQGYNNTFVGANTKATDLRFNNATAIGSNAEVAASNALVLGSINGVNGATASTNVGISTTVPTNIFTIGQSAGHAISDGWDTYSSRRWKTNIHPLQNALSNVERLRGVSYDLKDSGKHEIGVIAEEVGEVVPEVVSYEQNGKDARGVDYSRLTALLIEAIKQQQQEITAQRAQISKLRDKDARQVHALQTVAGQMKLLQSQLAQLAGSLGELRRAKRVSSPPFAAARTPVAVAASGTD
jgi:hypothetical protein